MEPPSARTTGRTTPAPSPTGTTAETTIGSLNSSTITLRASTIYYAPALFSILDILTFLLIVQQVVVWSFRPQPIRLMVLVRFLPLFGEGDKTVCRERLIFVC